MSMVINTNIQATRTHNVYNKNNDYMNQALSRVATGMKVNSAKDNASTWAISEKMRERIRANDQANQNVQNDTALLKTAQGGVGNTIDILKTLKERALNAANDSNMDTDRARIAEDVRQLVNQIDDNAAKVKFNGRTLLQGTVGNDSTARKLDTDPAPIVTAASGSATSVDDGASASALKPSNAVYTSTILNTSTMKTWNGSATANATITSKLIDLVNPSTSDGTDNLFTAGDKITLSWKDSSSTETKTATFTVKNDSTLTSLWSQMSSAKLDSVGIQSIGISTAANQTLTGVTSNLDTDSDGAGDATKIAAANTFYIVMKPDVVVSDQTGEGFKISVKHADGTTGDATTLTAGINPTVLAGNNPEYKAATAAGSSSELTFYVGGEANFGINVTFGAMTAKELLGSDASTGTFADMFLSKTALETGDGTNSVIQMIDNALDTALNEQTKLGAIENRLGYTSDNITTMNENLEAADSVFRDADIAKEMTQYMKYSVLAQASQYMLAQASQNAFSVLNLLQA